MRRAPFVIALGFASILTFAVAPASAQDRSGGVAHSAAAAPRYDGGARYGGRYYGSWYTPIRFLSPYYTFRARFSVGFGLFIGYPIAYSHSYYYPDYFYPYAYASPTPYAYPYRYPYAVPYPYAASKYPAPGPTYYQAPAGLDPPYQPQPPQETWVSVQPGVAQNQSNMGGVSFEIMPSDARVIVDGLDVGSVGQFTPTSPALGLPVGRHHIEIVASGYRTMSSDVDLHADQVIPFQGQMEH